MTQSLLENKNPENAPLAERMRPQRMQDLLGQEELLAPQGALGRLIAEKAALPSMILWGPPGCGKTTLARLLAGYQNSTYKSVSAVFGGVAELRQIFALAEKASKPFILFVDEIHHFSRAQQEAFLPVVERGTITLIGATTENPSFALRSALLSRCRVFVMKALGEKALHKLCQAYESINHTSLPLTTAARNLLVEYAEGDARALLNSIEAIASLKSTKNKENIDREELANLLQQRAPIYDKNQEAHYNLISALHKAVRGSDCDAALYWLARMLVAGEKPLFIARRLVRIAYEDIGLADPQAAQQALTAWQVYQRLGTPEGEIALFSTVVYLATAPKSNALYLAEKSASSAASKNGATMPPPHALNAPTSLMKSLGYGKEYKYDHNSENAFSGQCYFPTQMQREKYYKPSERGFEREIAKRLQYWQKLRENNNSNNQHNETLENNA